VSLQIILFRLLLLIEFFLVLGVSLVESTLKLAKAIGEVAEDIGATDLHKRLVSCLKENHELLVHVPEYVVTQYQIDSFPVLSYHALLIKVDVIALEIGGVLLLHHGRHVNSIVATETSRNVAAILPL
jgi:hypothetical protein